MPPQLGSRSGADREVVDRQVPIATSTATSEARSGTSNQRRVMFAEDGQFVDARGASAFDDCYSGPGEVRDSFARLFANCPNLAYRPLEPNWICGNKAVQQWQRTATTRAGEVQDWIGCDLLTFEGRPVKRAGRLPRPSGEACGRSKASIRIAA